MANGDQHVARSSTWIAPTSPEAAAAYLAAARAQSGALHPERALTLAERGAMLAREPADMDALNMLRGRLRCRAGEGTLAVDAYREALAVAATPAERCRALLGIAAGHRLTANVDAALRARSREAEPIAASHALIRERAELHYTRGNLYFARASRCRVPLRARSCTRLRAIARGSLSGRRAR